MSICPLLITLLKDLSKDVTVSFVSFTTLNSLSLKYRATPGLKLKNLGNLGNLFPIFFKSDFVVLVKGKNKKIGHQKTQINISDISNISEF